MPPVSSLDRPRCRRGRRLALAFLLLVPPLALFLAAWWRNPPPEQLGPVVLAPADGARLGRPLTATWIVRLPWFRWPAAAPAWELPETVQVVGGDRRVARIHWLTWDWQLATRLQPLALGRVEARSGRVPLSRWRGGAAAAALSVPLPAFDVQPVPVAADAVPRLAGPRPPPGWRERVAWWHGVLAGLALTALAWGAWRLVRARQRPPPPIPPWTVAAAALDELERQELPPALYFLRLTDIIRAYCEQRYGVRAAEMTTPEFIHHLTRNPVLPEAPRALLAGLLEQADAVKFAHGHATPPQLQEALARARRVVRDSVPPPPGPATP